MMLEKLSLFYFIFPLISSECWQHSVRSQTSRGPPARIMHPTLHVSAFHPENRHGLSVANSRTQIHMTSSNDEHQEEKPAKSLGSAIDDFGQALKPEAQKAAQKSIDAGTKSKKVLYFILSSCYYMLFILYRAYRGVFVLSPVIYRRVYAKLEEAVSSDIPKTDSDDVSTVGWRTRLTTTTISSIVVASYLLGGALRSISTFLKTMIRNKKSISQPFEAMIEEMELFSEEHLLD
mmetsp:Transcript_720/g.1314  ORF Transcript_720/g.1314 Transcript_720/m.1314 type:complete len:234 (-) Transcript_720:2717-3418(-)